MSWKPQVKVVGETSYNGNGQAFATEQEALESAQDLMDRWYAVTDIRAVESDQPVNYKRVDGRDARIE